MRQDDTQNMVLRTVFLPPETDDKLIAAAFRLGISKGDLLRQLITDGMTNLLEQKAIKGKRVTGARSRHVAHVPLGMD